jgi:hypothetical protein
MTYYTAFTVQGKMSFPLDMLRYDGCYPADSESLDWIHRKLSHATSSEYRTQAGHVRLITVHARKDWKPTADRWRSFGWTVTHVSRPEKM